MRRVAHFVLSFAMMMSGARLGAESPVILAIRALQGIRASIPAACAEE
jgi:hypothetical protein